MCVVGHGKFRASTSTSPQGRDQTKFVGTPYSITASSMSSDSIPGYADHHLQGTLSAADLVAGAPKNRRSSVGAQSPGPKHVCQICGKAFHRQQGLLHHTYIHTGEKPFKCWVCNAGFRQKGHVQRHMASVHQDLYLQELLHSNETSGNAPSNAS